jgi:hypothetical protein
MALSVQSNLSFRKLLTLPEPYVVNFMPTSYISLQWRGNLY